jgi:sulfur transfer protein SufE
LRPPRRSRGPSTGPTVFAAQRDYVAASFERFRQLNDRYRELLQVAAKAAAIPARR